MTEIESGVDIPLAHHSNKYSFGDMDVGDSFKVESEDAIRVRSAAHAYCKRYDMAFIVRKHEDAYRCWRTT